MAHFAQLDENNVVIQVIVVANEELLDETGQESEAKGIEFCKSLFKNETTNWVQTSYNHKFRKRYAGIGFLYNPALNAFIPPKPYPSWTLDAEKQDWVSPVPLPQDDKFYYWSEATQQWIEQDIPKILSRG